MRPLYILLFVLIGLPLGLHSQEADTVQVTDRPERPAFESNFLIDNPTDKIYVKNTLEVVMQHRFGTISGSEDFDLAGIWGAANIRLALSYTLHERLQVGFGTEKLGRYQDFNWKVGLLRQTRSGKVPVNVSYYGNWVIDASPGREFNMKQDRYSYFHQLIISRRFNSKFSMQVAPSISHFNAVREGADNDVFGVALGGRYKVSPNTAITMDWSIPITNWDEEAVENSWVNPVNGFSVGMEFVTSSHAFQIYFSNLNGITPQANYFGYPEPTRNYSFLDGFDSILLGFTITRLYNF